MCTAVIIVCALDASCRRFDKAEYEETILSARSALPIAVEIEKLFGSADHFITHYGFGDVTNIWNSEVHFGGRYRLTMQVEVKIDYRSNTITAVDEPRFFLVEYIEVVPLRDGRHEGRLGDTVRFSSREWEELYRSNGDFSVIGVELNNNEVLNFWNHVKNVRRDRIQVSLL
jgi:hypothetical protein